MGWEVKTDIIGQSQHALLGSNVKIFTWRLTGVNFLYIFGCKRYNTSVLTN